MTFNPYATLSPFVVEPTTTFLALVDGVVAFVVPTNTSPALVILMRSTWPVEPS